MKNCPYCNSSGGLCFGIRSRVYYRCPQCDLIYQTGDQSYHSVVSAYSENYFVKYATDQMEGRREKIFGHILDTIEEKAQIGSLLDVGTGCGFFLLNAKRRGWKVKGIEPSAESVGVARRQCGLDVFHGTLQDYEEDDPFDVITFVNALEYSALPWQEMDRASTFLAPGGLVYIRFLNGLLHSSIYRVSSLLGLHNQVRKFLVFHYYSFTPRFIKRLLLDKAFRDVTILTSPLTEGDPNGLFPSESLATYVKRLIYSAAKGLETISGRKLLVGTSLEVFAFKRD